MKNRAIILAIAVTSLLSLNVSATKKSSGLSNASARMSVSGVVIDKSTNEKLAGVMIRMTDDDQKIYSNSKGEFTLDGIAPGTYKVKINCISYKDKEVTMKVSGSRKDKVRIMLDPVKP